MRRSKDKTGARQAKRAMRKKQKARMVSSENRFYELSSVQKRQLRSLRSSWPAEAFGSPCHEGACDLIHRRRELEKGRQKGGPRSMEANRPTERVISRCETRWSGALGDGKAACRGDEREMVGRQVGGRWGTSFLSRNPALARWQLKGVDAKTETLAGGATDR